MSVINVDLAEESRKRYLTYALSVVSSRALPDVRDGLKPVQRRILYAMINNLHLTPEKGHRKSAAVVGEVLARYHPHGDAACYEAMVRMAQDFTYRYPLVDGQGNFGSLDGDSAAAYRYTEAKLSEFALEVIGEIGQNAVSERDNFDQTVKEPVVLPSRVPNLLVNGSSGIAVGMATSIPPHNLKEILNGLLLIIEDAEGVDAKLLSVIKGPDFPTGCEVVNSKQELREIYASGRGAIRMRASYKLEDGKKRLSGKRLIIVDSIPYSVDKSALVAQIADIIIARKVIQLLDVRDESTDEVRIVLEISKEAEADKIMSYLFKHTLLQQNFYVNLTALVPTENPFSGKPELLSLRKMLQHFIDFRIKVTRAKLEYERGKLEERLHLLEGLASLIDVLDEVIEIVRKSKGRQDAAVNLCKRFKITEAQALYVVDLRIYQLSQTSVEELTSELDSKRKRVAEINKILSSEKSLKAEVAVDFQRVLSLYGDERRSKVIGDYEEQEVKAEEFLQHEDVCVLVSRDAWLKRIRAGNDPNTARIREGDSLFFNAQASTKDVLLLLTSAGNIYGLAVYDLMPTTGFGEPAQKMFKFQDGELIVGAMIASSENANSNEQILFWTAQGNGFRTGLSQFGITKKIGRRVVRLSEGDVLQGFVKVKGNASLFVSRDGYGVCYLTSEIPELNAGSKGVRLQKIPSSDFLVQAICTDKESKVSLRLSDGKSAHIDMSTLTLASRGNRGVKVIKRGIVAGVRE